MDNAQLLFGEPKEMVFINPKLDFELSPEHFIKWLELEGMDITGDYGFDVCSMCEYACLYIGMMFYKKKLKGELKIYYGKLGFWEHYWVGYFVNGKEYFIDLTLKQFIKDAPELSISEARNERVPGQYSYLSEGTPLSEYVEGQRAFEFYHNPITMQEPPLKCEYKQFFN